MLNAKRQPVSFISFNLYSLSAASTDTMSRKRLKDDSIPAIHISIFYWPRVLEIREGKTHNPEWFSDEDFKELVTDIKKVSDKSRTC